MIESIFVSQPRFSHREFFQTGASCEMSDGLIGYQFPPEWPQPNLFQTGMISQCRHPRIGNSDMPHAEIFELRKFGRFHHSGITKPTSCKRDAFQIFESGEMFQTRSIIVVDGSVFIVKVAVMPKCQFFELCERLKELEFFVEEAGTI